MGEGSLASRPMCNAIASQMTGEALAETMCSVLVGRRSLGRRAVKAGGTRQENKGTQEGLADGRGKVRHFNPQILGHQNNCLRQFPWTPAPASSSHSIEDSEQETLTKPSSRLR